MAQKVVDDPKLNQARVDTAKTAVDKAIDDYNAEMKLAKALV